MHSQTMATLIRLRQETVDLEHQQLATCQRQLQQLREQRGSLQTEIRGLSTTSPVAGLWGPRELSSQLQRMDYLEQLRERERGLAQGELGQEQALEMQRQRLVAADQQLQIALKLQSRLAAAESQQRLQVEQRTMEEAWQSRHWQSRPLHT